MKKTVLIAMALCILSAGNVLAHTSKTNPLDRNAVWTNRAGHSGIYQKGHMDRSDSKISQSQKSSKRSSATMKVDGKHKKSDFIHETKSYDYNKDKGHSA